MPRPRRRLSIPARLREAGPSAGPRQRRATKKAGERPAVRRPAVQTAAPEVPEAFHLAQAQQPALPAVQQSVHPGSQTASTAQPIMGQPAPVTGHPTTGPPAMSAFQHASTSTTSTRPTRLGEWANIQETLGAGIGGGSSSTGSTLSFPMASMGVSGNNGDSLVYTQAPGSCSGGLSSYLSSRGNNARFTSGVPMGGMPTHTVASPQAVGIPGAHMTSHDVLLTPQAIVVDGVSTQPLPIPRLGSDSLWCGHVSQSLKEKIWKSEYIDISLLIKDSAAAALARSQKASEVALVVEGNKMFCGQT